MSQTFELTEDALLAVYRSGWVGGAITLGMDLTSNSDAPYPMRLAALEYRAANVSADALADPAARHECLQAARYAAGIDPLPAGSPSGVVIDVSPRGGRS